MHEQQRAEAEQAARAVKSAHYGNLYAAIVEHVAHHGPCTGQEIASAVGASSKAIWTYLSRAVRRGHLFRPERGVYEAGEGDPTGHWHRVCFSCGQPMRGGVK